jgi:hypothetical protein
MPKRIINAMKRGYKGKGLSEKEVNHRIYGKLNKMGFVKGSKETKKGVKAEAKYNKDH